MFDSWWPHGPQQARPPCPSPTPGVYLNPCPLSRRCHPTISSSVIPFSCLQSFPALFKWVTSASGGQRIGVSASTSVLPKDTQDWPPLGWTVWISLQSKGLSRCGVGEANSVKWPGSVIRRRPLWRVIRPTVDFVEAGKWTFRNSYIIEISEFICYPSLSSTQVHHYLQTWVGC